MYKLFLKRITRVVALSILAVMLGITFLYTVRTMGMLSENLDTSNKAYCAQLANALEMTLDQSAYQTYRFVLNNNGIPGLVSEMRTHPSRAVALTSLLSETLLSDRYYSSISLYSASDEWLLTVDPTRSQKTEAETLTDTELLRSLRAGTATSLAPRLTTYGSNIATLVYPVIVPVRTPGLDHSDCMLVTNINIGKIFHGLLKDAGETENICVYITDSQGRILVSEDWAQLGIALADLGYADYPRNIAASLISGKKMVFESSAPLQAQGWTLHTVQIDTPLLNRYLNLPLLLALVTALGLCVILVSWLLLRKTMRPVSELANSNYEHDIKEHLLSSVSPTSSAFSLHHEWFFAIFLQFADESAVVTEAVLADALAWPAISEHHLIPIQAGRTCLLIAYDGEIQPAFWQEWTANTHALLEERMGCKLVFTVSSHRRSSLPLSDAYQEAVMLTNYTMRMNHQRVLYWQDLHLSDETVAYPEILEKQLLNTLLVGNVEMCTALLDKFVSTIYAPDTFLQNQEVLNWLARLENAALVQAASIPLRLPGDIQSDFDVWENEESIREKLMTFFHIILNRINRQSNERSADMEQQVCDYIRDNLSDPHFSFTAVCDRFSIGRSQLTSIIRKKYGMGFSEYVSGCKMDLAKKLLNDRSLTIEAVAHQAGFTYSHYFIKVFKAQEGITPGQYRERIEEKQQGEIEISFGEDDTNEHTNN